MKAIKLGILLIIIQMLDGILTINGIIHFGIDYEANLLLHTFLINSVSPAKTIMTAKLLACFLIGFLSYVAYHSKIVTNCLIVIAFIYTSFAIVPWSYMLLNK